MRSSTGTPLGTMTYSPLFIGGGGFILDIHFSDDGLTKMVGTDVYNGYIKGPGDTVWRQAFLDPQGTGLFATPGDSGTTDGGGCALYSVAPSNGQIIYASRNSFIFRSADCGRTWTKTNAPSKHVFTNSGYNRWWGPWMAIDPANPNVVFAGYSGDGVWRSTDGMNFTQVNGIAQAVKPSTDPEMGPHLVVIDRSSAIVGGIHQVVYATSNGNGVYKSTDGGQNFALISGSPTAISRMAIDSLGRLYVTNTAISTDLTLRQTGFKYYDGGVWNSIDISTFFAESAYGVAVDPTDYHRLAIFDSDGNISYSEDRGATWTTYQANASSQHFNSPDIPWLDGASRRFIGSARFDPLHAGRLYISTGLGVSWVDIHAAKTAGVKLQWQEETLGIEELVGNVALSLPGDPDALFGCWDIPAWKGLSTKTSSFPMVVNGQTDLNRMWDFDYAIDNPQWVAGLVNGIDQLFSVSTDGGRTYHPVAQHPDGYSQGGAIAVGNTGNIIWIPSNNGRAVYTKNGGQSWQLLPIPGVAANGQESGWSFAYYFNRHIVACDKVTGNFLAINYGPTAVPSLCGVWRSTDQGDTWTRINQNVPGGGNGQCNNSKLRFVPGQAGNAFYCHGSDINYPLTRTTDGGVTWTNVPNVRQVGGIGFGKAAPGATYPVVFIQGWVNGVQGIWVSADNCATWTKLSTYPGGNMNDIGGIASDQNVYGRHYVGFSGCGWGRFDYSYALRLNTQ